MDWSKFASFAALPKEILAALERLPQLEARVLTLENALKGAPCPRCKLPGWHEMANAPAQTGSEFGLVDVTWECLRCGYRKVIPPE